MKIFAIATTILLANVAYAAPALVEACNPASVRVNFIGPVNTFVQYFPADGSIQEIPSIFTTKIQIPQSGYTGTFLGGDASLTFVEGPHTTDVGPPQFQVAGSILPKIKQILCV